MVTAICGGTAALFFALALTGYEPLQRLEYFTQDIRSRLGTKTPVDPRLVLIGIDRPAYDFADDEVRTDPTLGCLRKNFP